MTMSPFISGQRAASQADTAVRTDEQVHADADGGYAEDGDYGEAYEYTEGYGYAEGEDAGYVHAETRATAHAYAAEGADGEGSAYEDDGSYYEDQAEGDEAAYDEAAYAEDGYDAEPLPEMPAEVETLLAAMADLEHILRLETVAVDMVVPPLPLPEITTHKLNAEAAYRGAIAAVQCLPDGVAGLEPWIRDYLIAAAQSLADASQENIAAVAAARDAQQRLVDLVIDTVKHTRQAQGGYAHLAQTAASPHQRVAASVPAAVSKIL